MKKACIILPTYNENGNIGHLIESLEKVFQEKRMLHWDMSILVVDDDSPDGTAEIVEELRKKYHNLHLLRGQKVGLGMAYVRGFQHVLTNMDADYLFEMDADFQHDPHDIPRFLAQTELDYDFIIGSRYIPGGDCPDWPFRRKVASWGVNLVARYLAGIYFVNDCTSGFRCISTDFLRGIDLDSLKVKGYAFQMSLLHAAVKKKVKILQIPIVFPNRQKGKSKLGRKDIGEFFINAIRLRFRNYASTKN